MRKTNWLGLGIVSCCAIVLSALTASAQSSSLVDATKAKGSASPRALGDPEGTLALPSPAGDAYGLAVAGPNSFWHVALSPTDTIYLINSIGTVLNSFSVTTNSLSPNGIATDGTFLYVVDFQGQDVDIYDFDGNYQSSFAMPFALSGITYNPNTGNLYLVDGIGLTVDERTTAGVLVNNSPLPGSVFPIAMDYDAQRDGYWFFDFTKSTADLYSSDFSTIRKTISVAPATSGIAVSGNKLYAVDQATSTALIFDVTDFQLAAPFYLDNGANLSGSMPSSGVAAFIGVKNMSARSITLTITYTSADGVDFTPASNTVVLGPNQALSWRPAADDPAEGAGQAVPNITGGFPAGSVLITADGPITGRLVELDGDNSLSRAYGLQKP